MLSNHLILCRPLLSSVFASIRIFFSKLSLHYVTKYWSFSISPSSEYSQLVSFRIDWFDLLHVQGTLKSLLQHHSSLFLSEAEMCLESCGWRRIFIFEL